MSLRVRLTLWYVGVLAAILVVLGIGLYSLVSFSLSNAVDQTLASRAGDIGVSIKTTLAVQDPRDIIRRGGIIIPPADAFGAGDTYVQLTFSDGTVQRSGNLGTLTLPITQQQLTAVTRGQSIYTDLFIQQSPARAYLEPLTLETGTGDQEVFGVIEVAQSLREVNQTLAQLGEFMAISIAAALGIAAIVGALLARSALAPIDRISETAHTITRARDLGRRIEAPGTSDEVGRLAATINEMLARIEELFKVEQRFVADVSHELRSPLTAVRGNLDLLRRGAAEDPQAREEALSAVDTEVARMSRMVADLLLLARADAGVPIAHEPVELDTLLLDVYRQARMTANGVKITLGSEDQATVLGDRDRLKQALLNLVDNAVKYTPSGGEVKLSLEKGAEGVRLGVEDTGIGIAPEDMSHLFDRFYRVDKARARDAGGAGLGLAICKSVVDAHNGKITVESQTGKGSTFTIWLPYSNS
ncbi:MAG: HAMP domain-containing sensor histidine kinase [Anaerolineae bacterium]